MLRKYYVILYESKSAKKYQQRKKEGEIVITRMISFPGETVWLLKSHPRCRCD